MDDLVYNVYIENFNENKIERFNIFDHYLFTEDVNTIYNDYKNDYNTFCEEVKRHLMYYFHMKCEYEIILSDWPPSEKFRKEKISIYDQVMLNYNIFIKYVWEELNKED